MTDIGSDAWLTHHCQSLLDFGRRVEHPLGGAAWLDDAGLPDLTHPVHTWITGRMAHVYALGHLLGDCESAPIADAMLDALRGRLRDTINGGWYSSINDNGTTPDEKACYAQAFVVLAAASGSFAGRAGARELLDQALAEWNDRFFDAEQRMFVDLWNRDFTQCDSYRGVNGNMHSVEALLAAFDATGNRLWLERALGICERVALDFAEPHGWRIPEHFDPQWNPQLELNRDQPADPFKPYGATVGHGLEWARLLLHVEASLGSDAPDWMLPAAIALFDRAAADGWNVDGAEGFVYTTDWNGQAVVHDRMHWVAAEGANSAAALHARTGEARFAELAHQWWVYINGYLIDHELGSWHHQLDRHNLPIDTVWPGKPDLYHIVQTTLIPRLPLAPGLASALAART
ncbi:MAG: AGE family epimerase/isomerase [Actinobacteria bacterium]|nr:AGE family epimerase/isomerase [Actinomycetota bacterium]